MPAFLWVASQHQASLLPQSAFELLSNVVSSSQREQFAAYLCASFPTRPHRRRIHRPRPSFLMLRHRRTIRHRP